jgi:hypothetical protein
MDWRGGTPRTQELQRLGNPTLRSLMGNSRRQLPQVKVVRCRPGRGVFRRPRRGFGRRAAGSRSFGGASSGGAAFGGGGGAGTGCRPFAEIGLSSSGRGGFFSDLSRWTRDQFIRAMARDLPWRSGPVDEHRVDRSSRAGREAGNRLLSMLACSDCFPRLPLILTARPLVGMPAAGWVASPGGLGMARTSPTPPSPR